MLPTRLLTAAAILAAALSTSAAHARIAIWPPLPPTPRDYYVWIEPVYRIEYQRVWIPTRTERLAEQVFVPAVHGWRTVICIDEFGVRSERREYVEISPAHYETRYRDLVIEGRYETRQTRVLVSHGYWQYIGPPSPPIIIEPPIVIQPNPNPGTVGVDGYKQQLPNPDATKFSPLYEWPRP